MTESLTAKAQYRRELMHISRRSWDEQRALEEAAKSGDEEAKEQLIYEALHHIDYVAFNLSQTYQYTDDYLDLTQIGNLAAIENLDRSLSKAEPIGYLCGVARWAMVSYLSFHSRLIELPHASREELQKLQVPQAVSLETLTETEMESLFAELHLEPAEKPGFDTLYGPLHDAVQSLADVQRSTLIRHLGLYGNPEERLVDIDRDLGLERQSSSRYKNALRRLRKILKRA